MPSTHPFFQRIRHVLGRVLASGTRAAEPRDELVRVLGSLASYNDKGHIWLRHDADAQATFRAGEQARLRVLVDAIGRPALGDELVTAILTEAAMHDDSGRYVALARQRLGQAPR